MHESMRWTRRCVAMLACCAPLHAFAVLGGNAQSIDSDAVQLGASAPAAPLSKAALGAPASAGTAATAPYTVRQLDTPSGTVVREYLDSTGQVFGVAWQGPTIPNLRQLFGSHFDTYTSGVSRARAERPGRGPVTVDTGTLVVHSGGRMRAFAGQAYLSQQLPQGVSPTDIQ